MAGPFSVLKTLFAVICILALAVLRYIVAQLLALFWHVFPSRRPLSSYAVFQGNDQLLLNTLKRSSPRLTKSRFDSSVKPIVGADAELAGPIVWTAITKGNIGSVFRITLPLKTGAVTAIVKSTSSSFGSIMLNAALGLDEREYMAYAHLSRWVGAETPEVFFLGFHSLSFFGIARVGIELVVIMEDYGHMRHLSPHEGVCDFDDAKAAFVALGEFHAATWELPRDPKNGLQDWAEEGLSYEWSFRARIVDYIAPVLHDRFVRGPMGSVLGECKHIQASLERLNNIEQADRVKKLLQGFGVLEDSCNADGSRKLPTPVCMVHGDCRPSDNAFFASSRLWWVDFQCCSFRHPIADILYVLPDLSTEMATDRAKLTELFEVYVNTLETGVKRRNGDLGSIITVEQIFAAMPLGLVYMCMVCQLSAVAITDEKDQLAQIVTTGMRRIDKLVMAYGEK